MARDTNKIILVGNVGRDPDVRENGEGREAWLSLATVRPDPDPETDAERTDWHRLVARGKLADFFGEYVTAGTRIYVEGRLHYDCYEHEDGSGVLIPTADVLVREVILLRPDGGASSEQDR